MYFIHNKCASTLYDELMIKLSWDSITTKNIDWHNDIVISHIRNPLVKHRKGIIEGLSTYYPEMASCLTTKSGFKFLANVTSFDAHSYTIRQMLGKYAVMVRWIPIDIDLDHKKFTLELFEAHGAIIAQEVKHWFFELPKLNSSTEQELQWYNNLSSIKTPAVIARLIDFDLCLYNSVLVPAEPDNFKKRVAQLVQSGLSHSAAVNQTDAEVFSGDYTNWNF